MARHRLEGLETVGEQPANDEELSEEESISNPATDERSNSRPTDSGCVAYHLSVELQKWFSSFLRKSYFRKAKPKIITKLKELVLI